MPEFKVVIGAKDGKCVQQEVKDPDASAFLGKKIGDTIKGELLGHAGYEFEMTGGSDKSGFPMRRDVEGPNRKRILALGGVGIRKKHKSKGARTRKTVCGNTVGEKTVQINLKVTKAGSQPLAKAEEPAKEGEAEKQSK